MRLNVGCGDKYFPGFVNIDRNGDADVNCDAAPLPYEGDSATEIHAYHLIEHIHRKDVGDVLTEWFRVLKPGGKLVLEMPCLDKIAKLIVEGEKNVRLTLFGLFGDPRDPKPDMMHQWCYSGAELTELLTGIGFTDVVVEEPVFHIAQRDMRVTAVKP